MHPSCEFSCSVFLWTGACSNVGGGCPTRQLAVYRRGEEREGGGRREGGERREGRRGGRREEGGREREEGERKEIRRRERRE